MWRPGIPPFYIYKEVLACFITIWGLPEGVKGLYELHFKEDKNVTHIIIIVMIFAIFCWIMMTGSAIYTMLYSVVTVKGYFEQPTRNSIIKMIR